MTKIKDYKRKDFIPKIRPVYSVEEMLRLNKIDYKIFIKKRVNDIWNLVEKQRKFLLNFLNKLNFNRENQNYYIIIKNYCIKTLILGLYYFFPGWYLIFIVKFLNSKELWRLMVKKIRIKIYNHRMSVHNKLNSIEINRGVLLCFIPFILSGIIYIFVKFKPFENYAILEKNLPLFCYPVPTIKWETLIASEEAQKILLEEDNEIRFFRDYIIVRRKNDINLFGNLRCGNYIWASKPTPILKISDVFRDLDEFPKRLESKRLPRTRNFYNTKYFKDFLQFKASDQLREQFFKLRRIIDKENKINFFIRYGFTNSKSRLRFLSLLHRYKILSLLYSPNKFKQDPVIDTLDTGMIRTHPSQKLLKFTNKFKVLGIDDDETFYDDKDEWGRLPNRERYENRNPKFLNRLGNLVTARAKKIYINGLKNFKRRKNKRTAKIKKRSLNFKFIKNQKTRSKLKFHATTEKEYFLKYIDTLYNYQRRKRYGESKIYVKPRRMSGYTYPDSTANEVFWFRLREFLFPFEKYTTVKIQLPPNLLFRKVYQFNYPKVPELKNLLIATAVTKTPSGKSEKKITLLNNLSTPFDGDDSVRNYYDRSKFLNGAVESPVSYKGPGILLTKNNDIRLIYNAKKSPYFITQKENSAPMINVSLDYFMGNSNNYPTNKSYFPEQNSLKPWLYNYYSHDNPTLPNKLTLSQHTVLKRIPKDEYSFMMEKNAEFKRSFTREIGNYKYSIKRKNYWKKWGVFPFYKEFYVGQVHRFPNISSTPHSLLIGYNGDDWERRYITEEETFPLWEKEAFGPLEMRANTTYEKKRALSDLRGYCANILPMEQIYWPTSDAKANFKMGYSNELDYSPLLTALLGKIFYSISNSYEIESTKTENIWSNTTTQDSLRDDVYGSYRAFAAWEPLHKNIWLIIASVAFAYLSYMLVIETGRNYSREFLGYLIDLLHQTGYLPPHLRDELDILIGAKDPGYRIATDFTKGFKDIVGIDSFGAELIDTVFYLCGLVSNPAIAKNAQTVLLVGPPGTGKTILVHAMASAAKVPVLSLTAQGTQEPDALDRLFRKARKLSPCIVFFDEVDTIGRKRDGVLGYEDIHNEGFLRRSINDEFVPEMSTIIGQIEDINPQLLQNKDDFHKVVNRDVQNYLIKKTENEYYRVGLLLRLLVELDGIESRDGVVIIGATNRVNVLDPALVRAGRFNRHVRVPLPDLKKRKKMFQFYSQTLGSDPNIPWDYLAKLTFGYSAADISTIMNESCMKAIAEASLHTLKTIEHGIDRITTIGISKPSLKKGDHKTELCFSTLRDAYYQASKALVGTLLKHHPSIITVHLYYRENSVRYNQIQQTTLIEWLRSVCRGELEHRVIGSYAGRAGEFIFLQKYGDLLHDDSSTSNIGYQDWAVSQALITLLVDKWYVYLPHIALLQEQRPLLDHFNMFIYNEVKEQFLYEFAQIYENIPTGNSLLGNYADKNPQSNFQSSWLQMKLYQQYLSLEFQKWYSLWIPNPEEWKFNTYWVSPDNTFHQNSTKQNVSFGTKLKDLALLLRDYQIHSIIMEAFNISFLILTEYRELLDQLVYELIENEILREYTIHEIFANFGLDCKGLKEELLNTEVVFNKLSPDYKVLYPSWGLESSKPTIRWVDIKETLNSDINNVFVEAYSYTHQKIKELVKKAEQIHEKNESNEFPNSEKVTETENIEPTESNLTPSEIIDLYYPGLIKKQIINTNIKKNQLNDIGENNTDKNN